ncbi:MAG: hypothetical protein JST00_40280 [Deltaproteobacteria bacterium]|nr:hypothetical protein [Deltaproteobacteria bacterium]
MRPLRVLAAVASSTVTAWVVGCAAIAGVEPIDYRAVSEGGPAAEGGVDGDLRDTGGDVASEAGPPSACLEKAATAAFCEDFDPPAPVVPFTLEATGASLARVELGAGFSKPGGLRLRVAATGETAIAATPLLTGPKSLTSVTLSFAVKASSSNHVLATMVFPLSASECRFILRSQVFEGIEDGSVKGSFPIPASPDRFARYTIVFVDGGGETEVELRRDGVTLVPKTLVNCDTATNARVELGIRNAPITYDDVFDDVVVEIVR